MSVLIKDMKMPENCDVCRFVDWSNLHQTACCKLKDYQPCFSDYSREFETQRSTICPLVDLGKHGDLIDRDEVRDSVHGKDVEFVKRKKGKWTKDCACEICGFKPWYERDIHTLSFCPNCGADMREDNNG